MHRSVITSLTIFVGIDFIITPVNFLGLKHDYVKPCTIMSEDDYLPVIKAFFQEIKHWNPVGHINSDQDIIQNNYPEPAGRIHQ